MGIDASIPLQTRVFKPKSGVESYGEAMKLKNLAGQQRLQDMQMTQAKQGMADTATLREVALGANGDIDKYLADPRTLATDPTGTMKLRGDRTAQQMKQELDELTLTDKRYERTNQLLSSTFDQPSHDIAIQQALDEEIMTQDQAIQVAQYSDEQRDRFLGQTEQGRAELKRQFEQTKLEYDQNRDAKQDKLEAANVAYKKEQDKITNDRNAAADKIAADKFQFEKDKRERPNAPPGFEFSTDGKGLVATKGGPWDPKTIASKKTAEVRAKEAAEFDPVKIKASAAELLSILDGVYTPAIEDTAEFLHPGLRGSVGMKDSSYLWGMKNEPFSGTDEADFMGYYNQITGKQFMEAYKVLKGGGQITEIEGTKATQAMARMSTAQSEEAFIKGLEDFKEVVIALRDRSLARGREGVKDPTKLPDFSAVTQEDIDAELRSRGVIQ